MNLSPSVWLEVAAPYLLTAAAVTLALIAAALVALFAVPYAALRLRRRREEAPDPRGKGGLGAFTWTSVEDDDRRAG